MPKLTKLACALGFAAMLLGLGLLFRLWPGQLSDAVPLTRMPTSAVASSVFDEDTYMPTQTPTPSDSAAATPWAPTGTSSLPATATQPSTVAAPWRTPEPPTATQPSTVAAPSRTPEPATSPPPPSAKEPAEFLPTGQLTADESNLFAMVNDERTRAGLPRLVLDPVLQAIAHGRASDMIARKFYSHIDPATGQLAAKAMLLKLGVRYSTSENFYSSGPYNAGFVGRSMQWLMGDAVHRANILLRFWNTVGVGVAGTPDGIAVVTQEFGAK